MLEAVSLSVRTPIVVFQVKKIIDIKFRLFAFTHLIFGLICFNLYLAGQLIFLITGYPACHIRYRILPGNRYQNQRNIRLETVGQMSSVLSLFIMITRTGSYVFFSSLQFCEAWIRILRRDSELDKTHANPHLHDGK